MIRKEIATCNSCLEVFDADKCVDENRQCMGNVPTCPYCKSDDLTFTIPIPSEIATDKEITMHAPDEKWMETKEGIFEHCMFGKMCYSIDPFVVHEAMKTAALEAMEIYKNKK